MNRPILLLLHGYGKRRTIDFERFIEYAYEASFDIVKIDLYEVSNDYHYRDWLKRAKECIEQCLSQSDTVYVLGFSMGGVIASYLTQKYPISKLILIAPAFKYISVHTLKRMFKLYYQVYKKGNPYFLNYFKQRSLLDLRYSISFLSLVSYVKRNLNSIKCPTLIMVSKKDEFVPYQSCEKLFTEIENTKKELIVYNLGSHELLDKEEVAYDAFKKILKFLEGEL